MSITARKLENTSICGDPTNLKIIHKIKEVSRKRKFIFN